MKKAKRRNLTEDQKKNIFSGFGGFTSTNQSAEEAFSFLGKSKDTSSEDKESQNKGIFGSEQGKDTKSNTGFVFGGNKDSNGSNSIFGGFTFGNGIKKIEENTKNETKEEDSKKDSKEKDSKDISKDEDLFSKFKPKSGSWSCGVCMISNDSTKSKCLACETPKPSTNPAKSSEPSPAPKSDDLMDKFKAKAGNWSCGVCMISNSADKSKCAACETPNPKAPAPKSDDLMAKFMTKSDKWTCDTCMISNPADKIKCVACETLKPGASKPAEEPSKPSFSFGSTGGFQFMDKSATSQSNSAFANFKFGASQPTTTDTSGGFKFGSSSGETSSESKKETSGGFKFGSSTEAASTESKKESLGGFRFGSSTKEETAETKKETLGGFTFGSVKTNPPVSQPEGGGGFKFGSSETISSPTGQIKDFAIPAVKDKEAIVPDTPKTKTRRNEYLASLKALNVQVTSWIKSHVDDNPLVDLTPVFVDYEKHIGELKTKFNVQASLSTAQKKTLQFDQDNSDTSD